MGAGRAPCEGPIWAQAKLFEISPGFEDLLGSPWEVLLEEDEDLPPEKERVLLITGEYALKDFLEAFDALCDWDDLAVIDAEIADRYAAFSWTRAYPPNHWNPTSRMPGARQNLGRLVLEGSSLTVEVRARSWMLTMDERLHEVFGSAITRGSLAGGEAGDSVLLFPCRFLVGGHEKIYSARVAVRRILLDMIMPAIRSGDKISAIRSDLEKHHDK